MPLSESGSSPRAAGASGSTLPCRRVLAAAFTVTGLFPLDAAALFGDSVELWAAENVTHDTNVLRLSKTLDPASIGATQLSDTVYTTHIGVNATLRASRQVVNAEVTWYRSNYRYFKDLDFTGHTVRAHWQWIVEQDFTGTLGYVESEGLSSFNNIQRRAPDLVTSRNFYWTGNWMVTPRYRATAAANATEARHSDPLRQVNNIDIDSFEAGLAYVTPLDNTAGAFMRVEHGMTPNAADGSLAADNEYRQLGAGVTVTWLPGPHSRFVGRAELVKRDYERGARRDYSGPIVRAVYTWTPTPKFALAAALSRDVGPAEEAQTSFVLVTAAYVRPRWNVTEKIAIVGNAEYSVWDYQGDPVAGGDFKHRVRTFGTSLTYRPTPRILLSAGINREVRTSDLPTGDYEVTVGFVEGRIGF